MTGQDRVTVARADGRHEDDRLVRGRGRYLANVPRGPRTLHAVIVRSETPHGRIRAVDTTAALGVDGVVAVLTVDELRPVLDPLPSIVPGAPAYLPLAAGTVRYVGEPVAVVLARDATSAHDGAACVSVDVEPLPVVAGLDEALAPDAPALHDGGNVVWSRTYRYGDPGAAFARASRVVHARLRFPRYNSTPLETYAVVAEWCGADTGYLVQANFQGPFSLLGVLARGLKVPEHQVRLQVPEDVGGSFGIKAMVYPYVALIAACARVVGRPVAWFEERSEHLLGSTSGTERLTDVAVAVDEDGRIHAIRADIAEDVGAYLRAPEPSCVMRSLTLFSGPYRIDHGETTARVVLTNRVPTGLNRGYGGQQHCFTVERVIDAVAHELGLDPAEVRRRNLVEPGEFPLRKTSGTLYDSGDYGRCLELALARAGYDALRAEQRDRRARGDVRQLGIGLATIVHSSAANIGYVTLALDPAERARPGYRAKSGARDTAEVSLLPSGRIRVRIATAGAGQSHATTAAQIAAGVLGVPTSSIDVVDVLDTAEPLWGTTSGAYSSRFTVVVGNAVARAATSLRERLRALGALVLEAAPEDVELTDGAVVPRGAPARALSLRTLAGIVQWDSGSLGPDAPTDLACTASWGPPHLEPPDEQDRVNAASAYGFMADVAVVEVDVETGKVEVRSYTAVHDVGRALNPVVVSGQIAGGILHGIGGALYEHTAYDDGGNPLCGNLVTYLSPTAPEAPEMRIEHHDTPSPFNPLGVKGCGENSAMSAPAAVAAAVEDALTPYGVRVDHLPITPQWVWRAIHDSREQR